jgi:ATP-binding cassette subfamily C protein LapB
MTDMQKKAAQLDSGEDSSAKFDGSLQEQPLPAKVLKLLFERLDISVQMGALIQACEQADKSLTDAAPAKRFSFIAHTLKLQGVQAAQLRWSRFDQRRLPALIFYQGEWQLIEQGSEG